VKSSSEGISVVTGIWDDIIIYKCAYALRPYTNHAFSISNVKLRENTYAVYADEISNDKYIINGDVDSWAFAYSAPSTAAIFRQYSFELAVTTAANVPIPNANVTLSYYGEGGGIHGTWLTDANGAIPSQTVTAGFYNQTGGDTIYTYNPYELTITKDEYLTYQRNFTQLEKKSWNIALLPEPTYATSAWVLSGAFLVALLAGGFTLIISVVLMGKRR